MTTAFCSNKLKDFIGSANLSKVDSLTASGYGDWNAHLFLFGKHKHIIFVNNKTYYSLIIENIRKADFKDFETLFFNRLIEQFIFDKVIDQSESLIILQKLLPLRLAFTNNDKKAIGTLNDFVYQYKCNRNSVHWFYRKIIEINNSINNSLTGAGRNNEQRYGRPIIEMAAIINTSP
jgi:hypothetical protein